MSRGITPEALEPLRERDDLTLKELVEAAAELLPRIAPSQPRYKVQERPDSRTIRYYTSQGLLPKPLGYTGGRARYGFTHLVRLLLIKRLQAERHTLARIGDLLRGATDADVLAALEVPGEERSIEADVKPPPKAPPFASGPSPFQLALVVTLPNGGRVEVPPEAMQDPAQRQAIADDLLALGRWLRDEQVTRPGGER
jgi:DNA-binding transcriptional MerR regulator